MTDAHHTTDENAVSLKTLIRQLVIGLVIMAVVSYAAGQFLQEPIGIVGGWFVDHFGLGGIFFGQLVLDSVPFTVSEPLLLAGIDGGLSFWSVTTIAGFGSWCAGSVGWLAGRLLGNWDITQRMFKRYRVHQFMEQYGSAFVAVGALTPFPYSITTYAAGASGMGLGRVMLSALLRFPKTWGYMALVYASYYGGPLGLLP